MSRARERCVVDASAALAVLFREPGFADVLRVLPSTGMVAPPLLALEVANVSREKVRRGEVERTHAETLLADLDAWRVRSIHVAPRDAWDIAWSHRLTLYDASYLHVAVARDLPIVTLDRELRRAAGRRARP